MKKVDNNIYEVDVSDIRCLFPMRDIDCNKGDFGKTGIYGGSVEYSGALKLASLSLGALRSGTGISRIITSRDVLPLLGSNILEQTLVVLPDYEDSHFREKLYDSISDLDSLAFGMGLGNDSHLEEVLEFLINVGIKNVVFNLENVYRMDISGFKSLIKCYDISSKYGGTSMICINKDKFDFDFEHFNVVSDELSAVNLINI